jgi:hypothetical protein
MSEFIVCTTSSALRAAGSRVSARDRRRAAVHEAGHVVVARHLGVRILQAEIRKIEPQDSTEKEWVGSVQCLTEGVVASKRKVLAVAGLVAEACWDGGMFSELYDALELSPGDMSQADWDHSGCLPGEPSEQFGDEMEQAFELLNRETGKLWSALLVEARVLIVRSRRNAALFRHPVEGESNFPAP